MNKSQPLWALTPEGDTLCEWWNENRSLSIYIKDLEIAYLKSWGIDMDTEMEYGRIGTADEINRLLDWLYEVGNRANLSQFNIESKGNNNVG